MKVLIIGASGTIGKAVSTALSTDHKVIEANYSGGEITVDIANKNSIKAMFEKVGKVDAVISTAGLANFAPFTETKDDDYELALNNKLMGQLNLVRIGRGFLNEKGSITLTSGVLSREPMPGSATISMANGALESYVKAAALEIKNYRLNVVAPVFIKETMAMMGMPTDDGLSAADTAKAYVASVTGDLHGATLDAPDFA